jgi:hypothetical protein
VASTRLIVEPPGFTPRPYSLSSVVTWRDGDRHWQAGVKWQTVCGDAGSTYDECVIIGATSGAVTGDPVPFPAPPAKTFTATMQTFGATPFTIFAEVDCSAVGFYEDSAEYARQVFVEHESTTLEQIFATGVVAGVANAQYPHLQANAAVLDVEAGASVVTLQQAATVVTGGPVCIEVALGLLEAELARCHAGQGIIHVPIELIALMDNAYLLERVGGQLLTGAGNVVVPGAGYLGAGPDGTFTAAVRWMYATPPMFGYRSDIRVMPPVSTLDRTDNTVMAIIERNYVLGYDCCLVAVPVSLSCG